MTSPLALVISDDTPALTGAQFREKRREAWRRWKILLVRREELSDARDRQALEAIARKVI